MLRDSFAQTAQIYSREPDLVKKLWAEVEQSYSSKKRHYHTLTHLENLLDRLHEVRDQIQDWDVIVFAIVYHDIIYSATKKDNEEKSKDVAANRLRSLGVPSQQISRCVAHILASKSHTTSLDPDTNLFTDADLSILGSSWDEYFQYSKQVRSEYSIYPDFLYNPGRKKVLQHFLSMEKIFKTEHFYSRYEEQARTNLTAELEKL
jgi:predicted metal-dependent HD superfamily phosphohydrolase